MSKRKPNKNKKSSQENQRKSASKKTVASRKTSSVNWKNIQPKDSITLVIPCYNEERRVDLLVNGIRKFDKQWGRSYELLIVDDGSSDGTVAAIQNKLDNLTNASNFEVIALEKNQGKGNALKAGVAKATGDFILTLDADMAAEPLELKKWLAELPEQRFPKNEILIASREHKDSKVGAPLSRKIVGNLFNFIIQLFTSLTNKDTQCGFKLYPAALAKELFANMKVGGWAHDIELLYKGKLNGATIRSMPIVWKHVDDSKISVWKDGIMMVFISIFTAWRIKFDWFILQPIREIGKKTINTGENSIYRLLFVLTALAIILIIPTIYSDFGITGDEHVQKIYGEMINQHFETDGAYVYEGSDAKFKGQNALNMTPNLFYYGGSFDYLCAKIYSFFGSDPYETRHLINAFVGFLLMFFTGLLAKEISGSWKIGFLALLMVALSPRIFGHSFNNPKDIPFAAAYMFTLLNIIRFVKQLPSPSAKTVVYLILGIAGAISVRIGGLLLIAYLGLFVGIAFLWKKELRQQLLNIPLLIRVAFLGALAAGLGYLGGLFYWPFGWESPIENPMKALEEMSSFDTAIQMLYEGVHVWSDRLPGYYVPKWMIMTAPIAVALGMLMFLPIAFLNKNRSTLLLGLTAFAAVFPPLYALSQDSPLYDGMRHFLFIYPVLVVLAAYAWGKLGELIPNKMGQMATTIAPIVLLALPLMWMVKNHPYHYTYINEAYGGTKAAEHTYETDYWMISVKPLVKWAAENIPEIKEGKEVTICMSDQVEAARHYFKTYAPNVKVYWSRYAERDKKNYNWDYTILFNRFMNEGHMKNGAWPPYEVLHEEKSGGVTMGVVCKKTSRAGGEGRKALSQQRFQDAITAFNQELSVYPKNELAWLGLAEAARSLGDYPTMKKAVDGAMGLSNSHVNTLGMAGMYHFFKYDNSRRTNPAAPDNAALDSAIIVFEKAIELNYKYANGYYFLTNCYVQPQKYNAKKVFEYVEAFSENNGNIPQIYDVGIQVAQREKDQLRANYFTARKALLQNNGQQAYQLAKQIFETNPKYEPGRKFWEMMDELAKKQQKQQLQK
jgi:glycosyltransferase involved in cell wall biosynthesis/tetratricopeptide (TPR) repeat protein